MILMDEKFDSVEGRCAGRTRVAGLGSGGGVLEGWTLMERRSALATVVLLLSIPVLVGACGPRRLNVMHTPEQNLVAIGYSADRSGSVLRANNDALQYCERQKKDVVLLKEDTVYQGQYDESITAAARTAGRVAGALGSAKGAQAGGSLSSSTDYKTTFEFVCK
jgi:hypothetical protein